MPKEYRTIEEVAGPLMLVKGVDGVCYNELGEIELEKNAAVRFLKSTAPMRWFSFLKTAQELTFQTARSDFSAEVWSSA